MKKSEMPALDMDFRPDRGMSYFSSMRHKNVKCGKHLHLHQEVVIVTKGTLIIEMESSAVSISAGQGWFLPPFSIHGFDSPQSNQSHILEFSKDLALQFYEFVKAHRLTDGRFEVPGYLIELLDKILPEQKSRPNDLAVQSVLAPLCYEIYEQCSFCLQKEPYDEALFQALEYINLHFCDSISLEGTAKIVGIHPVTLSRKFTRYTGISFHAYVNALRCAYAASLLKDSRISSTEAAYEAGFGSIRSFNRVFAQTYGITPTEFKRTQGIL